MFSNSQVAKLISFYNEQVDEIKQYGSDSELDAFEFYFDSFLECIDCSAVFEEGHLVDIEEW